MAAGPIPVTFDGFRRDVNLDVEVFGASVHDLAHDPQLVSHVESHARADLDFVLATHDFTVGS